jgi:hypothetical protein
MVRQHHIDDMTWHTECVVGEARQLVMDVPVDLPFDAVACGSALTWSFGAAGTVGGRPSTYRWLSEPSSSQSNCHH